jgi:hypothetical protein
METNTLQRPESTSLAALPAWHEQSFPPPAAWLDKVHEACGEDATADANELHVGALILECILTGWEVRIWTLPDLKIAAALNWTRHGGDYQLQATGESIYDALVGVMEMREPFCDGCGCFAGQCACDAEDWGRA